MTASATDLDQTDFAFRLDWGPGGLATLAPACDVIVIVDVLRFTSAVATAVAAGAMVYPYLWRDERAAAFADSHGATLAGDGIGSLSPVALSAARAGSRIVLPSPNGSSLSFEALAHRVPFVLAGSLRNAAATARRAGALAHGGGIGVVAAGERHDDGSVRFAVEDLIGAGAILHRLDPAGSVGSPACSPEASAARAAFLDARPRLDEVLLACGSGRELRRRGFVDDVRCAAELDVSDVAAHLTDGAFVGV